jgi:hypothetical protein
MRNGPGPGHHRTKPIGDAGGGAEVLGFRPLPRCARGPAAGGRLDAVIGRHRRSEAPGSGALKRRGGLMYIGVGALILIIILLIIFVL